MPTARPREVDPSRTILLRRQARRKLRACFQAFKVALRKAPTTDLAAFQTWYEKATRDLLSEALWHPFIVAAFKKGVTRGYEDSKKGHGRAKDEFVSDSMASVPKLELLADRTVDEVENCLTDLGNKLSRVVANKLLSNDAKGLAPVADGGAWRLEVIARTEMIRAHAEGQLHALARLGHRVVGVMAEFHSTDDDLTCEECQALDGQLYAIADAHGVIPVHPLCRCAWLPGYEPDEEDDSKPVMSMNKWVTLESGQHVVVGDDGTISPRPKYGSTDQPYWHPGMNPTVDMVVTRDGEHGKEVLLIKRSKESKAFPDQWALPGGFHDTDAKKGEPWKPGRETKRQAALRELQEETGIKLSSRAVSRVGVFQGPGRDPRDNSHAWSQSTAFKVHIKGDAKVKGGDDAQAAKWVPLDQVKSLAFDHARILHKAGVRLTTNENPNHDAKGRFASAAGEAEDTGAEKRRIYVDAGLLESHTSELVTRLTSGEIETLRGYSKSDYYYINGAMRKCPPTFECVSGLMKAYMDDINSAFSKAKPLPKEVPVARYVNLGPETREKTFAKCEEMIKSGETYSMPSFTSTSVNTLGLSENPDFAGPNHVRFNIIAKTGIYMSREISAHPEELELLQAPKTKYRIVSVDREKLHINLEEVTE